MRSSKMALPETLEVDTQEQKMGYPKSIFFIISTEFCERYSFYGMRTALSLYLLEILMYSEDTSTVIYHLFSMLAYFFPLVGAIIADSWLGKYRTILYLGSIYAFGQLLLAVSSVSVLHLPIREMSLMGLGLIALGTGGIKPCVTSFGGDQFKLPEQERYLSTFFSLFYFSINMGSLMSTFITPILRKDISCFGQRTCYPLAFFIPAALMITAVAVFFAGKRLYHIKKPEGNVIVKVGRCLCYAIKRKMKSKENRAHWLDHAKDKYDNTTIDEIKSVLRVLKLFLPLPVFWALFDQQGSRWTFQATRMNGMIFGYLIKPDQFQFVNPFFILSFIPLFQIWIYPIIAKYLYINTPLRKITVGGMLAGVAFIISGLVEFQLEKTYPIQPSMELAQVRIYNTIDCDAKLTIDNKKFTLGALDVYQDLKIPCKGAKSLAYSLDYGSCASGPGSISGSLEAKENAALSWAVTSSGMSSPIMDTVQKSKSGDPLVRALITLEADSASQRTLTLHMGNQNYDIPITKNLNFSAYVEVDHATYKASIDGAPVADISFFIGGAYTIVGSIADGTRILKEVSVALPNSMHIFWLLPQYICMTMGEVMLSITGLEFAFTQAPASMKAILQAGFLLTIACGNLMVVIIARAHFFSRQVFEFFLFAVLMFIDMFIFALLARKYTYVRNEPK